MTQGTSGTSSVTLAWYDHLISIAGSQGIGAVIAVLLVVKVTDRLDMLIARVGDLVIACNAMAAR